MAGMKVKLIPIAKTDIPTATTRVQLNGGVSRKCTTVLLKAASANTGNIYVGDSTVDSSLCHPLAPGQDLIINADQDLENEDKTYIDLADIWVDTATNGNDIHISVIDLVAVSYVS